MRRIGSLALGLSVVWLIVFHAVLFWRRIADATIQHPGVLARWLASAFLIVAALAANRYGSRHLRRRHLGLVFGLLVLLLHLSIPAQERLLGMDESVAVVTQSALVGLGAILFLVVPFLSAVAVEHVGFVVQPSGRAHVEHLASWRAPRAPPEL